MARTIELTLLQCAEDELMILLMKVDEIKDANSRETNCLKTTHAVLAEPRA
jgi:hypothetical protein